MNKAVLIGIGVIAVGAGAALFWGGALSPDLKKPTVSTAMHGKEAAARAKAADDIIVPKLTPTAQMGKIAFENNCSACHGANAAGTDYGPPLVHKIYEPSHHSDYAFLLAAKNGVQAHHWRFGNMEPVEGVTEKQVEWIAKYIREMQRANGIY